MVHPVIGRDHGVGIERGDDVVDDFFLREAEFGRVNAIHFEADGGIIHVLRNVDLADAGQIADLLCQAFGCVVGGVEVAAADLDIDWRGRAHVQDRVHHGAAGKEGAQVGISGRDLSAHAVHVFEAAHTV